MLQQDEDFVWKLEAGVLIVRLSIENLLGGTDVHRVSGKLGDLLADHRKILIDFKHVKHVGSAALGMILSLNNRVKALGGRLILTSLPPVMHELLRVSKTAKLFEIADDPREGFKALTAR